MNRERDLRGREGERERECVYVCVCALTCVHYLFLCVWAAASLTEKLCPTPSPWDLPDPQQRSNESKIKKKHLNWPFNLSVILYTVQVRHNNLCFQIVKRCDLQCARTPLQQTLPKKKRWTPRAFDEMRMLRHTTSASWVSSDTGNKCSAGQTLLAASCSST